MPVKKSDMKRLGLKLIFCCILAGGLETLQAQIKVGQLWVENKVNPAGIAVTQPRFSFASTSTGKAVLQTAYEIRVAASLSDLQRGKKLLWNSGKVPSDASLHVLYAGSPLKSMQKYFWQVKVWDNQKNESEWSAPADFITGIMHKQDWRAKWIEPGFQEDTVLRPSPLLRKEFTLSKKVQSAKVVMTAHGLYEAFINGKKVGNGFLTPGWTSYNKRLAYQTYDVTDMVTSGNNAVGVMLGSAIVLSVALFALRYAPFGVRWTTKSPPRTGSSRYVRS